MPARQLLSPTKNHPLNICSVSDFPGRARRNKVPPIHYSVGSKFAWLVSV
jgi:hypothetical protein